MAYGRKIDAAAGNQSVHTSWGAHVAARDGNIHAHLPAIGRVQLFDLAELLSHDITHVAGMRSHTLRFVGGGHLHYAHNQRGELVEFRGYRITASFDRDGNVTVGDFSRAVPALPAGRASASRPLAGPPRSGA